MPKAPFISVNYDRRSRSVTFLPNHLLYPTATRSENNRNYCNYSLLSDPVFAPHYPELKTYGVHWNATPKGNKKSKKKLWKKK